MSELCAVTGCAHPACAGKQPLTVRAGTHLVPVPWLKLAEAGSSTLAAMSAATALACSRADSLCASSALVSSRMSYLLRILQEQCGSQQQSCDSLAASHLLLCRKAALGAARP